MNLPSKAPRILRAGSDLALPLSPALSLLAARGPLRASEGLWGESPPSALLRGGEGLRPSEGGERGREGCCGRGGD